MLKQRGVRQAILQADRSCLLSSIMSSCSFSLSQTEVLSQRTNQPSSFTRFIRWKNQCVLCMFIFHKGWLDGAKAMGTFQCQGIQLLWILVRLGSFAHSSEGVSWQVIEKNQDQLKPKNSLQVSLYLRHCIFCIIVGDNVTIGNTFLQ